MASALSGYTWIAHYRCHIDIWWQCVSNLSGCLQWWIEIKKGLRTKQMKWHIKAKKKMQVQQSMHICCFKRTPLADQSKWLVEITRVNHHQWARWLGFKKYSCFIPKDNIYNIKIDSLTLQLKINSQLLAAHLNNTEIHQIEMTTPGNWVERQDTHLTTWSVTKIECHWHSALPNASTMPTFCLSSLEL